MRPDSKYWQGVVADNLKGWKLRMQQAGVRSVYAFLSAAALWPFLEAYQGGNVSAMIALGSILSNVGGNLLANQIEKWKDEKTAAKALDDSLDSNKALCTELDEILEKLNVLSQAQAALSDYDRSWFQETIRFELKKLGNWDRHKQYINNLYISNVNTGGGDVIQQVIYHQHRSEERSSESFESLVLRLDSRLTRQDIEQSIRMWLHKNLWLQKGLVDKLGLPLSLKLEQWPIFIYQGKCRVKYSIRQYKDDSANDKGSGLFWRGEEWYRINQTSKAIPIALVSAETPAHANLAQSEQINHIVQVINGRKSRLESNTLSFNLAMMIVSRIPSSLWYMMKYLWQGDTGLYQSPHPIWPNLQPAKRFMKSITLNNVTGHESAIYRTESKLHSRALTEIQSEVRAILESVVRKTEYAELSDIHFWGSQLSAVLFPFWLLDTEVDGVPHIMVLNGINGDVIYARLPVNRVTHIVLIVILFILVLAVFVFLFEWLAL